MHFSPHLRSSHANIFALGLLLSHHNQISEDKAILQVEAFKDFSPEGSGGQEAAAASQGDEKEEGDPTEKEEEGAVEEEQDQGDNEEVEEEASGSGGDYPAHTLAGLPALSPTMSQGCSHLHQAGSSSSSLGSHQDNKYWIMYPGIKSWYRLQFYARKDDTVIFGKHNAAKVYPAQLTMQK